MAFTDIIAPWLSQLPALVQPVAGTIQQGQTMDAEKKK